MNIKEKTEEAYQESKKRIPIVDISDKGMKQGKTFRYEVGFLHTANENETPEITAKFKSYGDAYTFAFNAAKGNMYYAGILIRS